MSMEERFPTILAAARAGEEWALAELYRDLHPRILRYLRALEPAEAEDLASEVWLDVARGLGGSKATTGPFELGRSPSPGGGWSTCAGSGLDDPRSPPPWSASSSGAASGTSRRRPWPA